MSITTYDLKKATTLDKLNPKLGDSFILPKYDFSLLTVVAISDGNLMCVLGSKENLSHLFGESYNCLSLKFNGIQRPSEVNGCLMVNDISSYFYGFWAYIPYTLVIQPETPPVSASNGMTCSGKNCLEPFNQFAEPNQPDGSFLCYSCRQLPSYMR